MTQKEINEGSKPREIAPHDGACDHCGRIPTIVMPTSLCDECADGVKRAESAELKLHRADKEVEALNKELDLAIKQTDSWIANANREQALRVAAEAAAAQARKNADLWLAEVRMLREQKTLWQGRTNESVAEARKDAFKECTEIARSEKVDAESTQEPTDFAYNGACEDIAKAIERAAAATMRARNK